MERSSVRPNGGGVNAVPLAPAAGSHSHKPLRLSQLPPSRASCGRGYSGSGAALVGSMVAPQRVTMSASLPGTFAEQRCRCHGTRGDPAAAVPAAEGVKTAAARADTVAIRRSDSGTAIGSRTAAAGAPRRTPILLPIPCPIRCVPAASAQIAPLEEDERKRECENGPKATRTHLGR
jgi:hypothetical protein